MVNKNPISQLINHTRKIEETNQTNIEYSSTISSLVNSDSCNQVIDKELETKLKKLNSKISDINKLTSELLNDLSKRHN